MSKSPELWFHDSFILKFSRIDNSIILEIAHAVDKYENNYHVIINFDDVKNIETDAIVDNSNLMPVEHGEILTLDIKRNNAELIAQWIDFNGREPFVNFYNIHCNKIHIEAQPMKSVTEEV